MALLCRIFGHARPRQKPLWNDGFFFGACARCTTDLVRQPHEPRWKPVPPGYRIAWRDRTEADIRW